ncbi:hypothetical protein VPH35_045458 [Triticum aestivum]
MVCILVNIHTAYMLQRRICILQFQTLRMCFEFCSLGHIYHWDLVGQLCRGFQDIVWLPLFPCCLHRVAWLLELIGLIWFMEGILANIFLRSVLPYLLLPEV